MNGSDKKRISEELARARSSLENAEHMVRNIDHASVKMVLAFIFSSTGSHVLVQRKSHPAMMHRKLNGIGGHFMDFEETTKLVLDREFIEETMCSTPPEWMLVATLRFPISGEHVYVACGRMKDVDLAQIEEKTRDFDEPCMVLFTRHVMGAHHSDLLPDVPFLVSLCYASMFDGDARVYDITVR